MRVDSKDQVDFRTSLGRGVRVVRVNTSLVMPRVQIFFEDRNGDVQPTSIFLDDLLALVGEAGYNVSEVV